MVWKWLRRLGFIAVLGAFGMITLATTAYSINWYRYRRPQPPRTAETRAIREGVTYERIPVDTPRPILVHIIAIDTETAEPIFFVTPPDVDAAMANFDADRFRLFESRVDADRLDVPSRKTTDFAAEFDLDIAINASFYYPIFNNPFALNAYPQPGEPLGVLGQTVSDGVSYQADQSATTACFYDNERFVFKMGRCTEFPDQSVGGFSLFVVDGAYSPEGVGPDRSSDTPYPRTVMGLDESGTILYLIAVDGRQFRYSEGVTWDELAEILIPLGVDRAIGLDGGGSTTLVVDEGRGPKILNSPIHLRIPGHERPVATHVGVRFDD